jgi:RNA polymerase sigma-70 factor (sigma-E family)
VAVHDDSSFEAFVAARGAALLRTARLLCRAPEDAEDICQAALERAYRNWTRVHADRDPEPYVRRILVNLVISRARRAKLLTFVPLLSVSEPAAYGHPPEVELRGELIRGLRALPPRQRAVLVLRYWEDLPEAQVADVLGCAVGTVKAHAPGERGVVPVRRSGPAPRPSRTRWPIRVRGTGVRTSGRLDIGRVLVLHQSLGHGAGHPRDDYRPGRLRRRRTAGRGRAAYSVVAGQECGTVHPAGRAARARSGGFRRYCRHLVAAAGSGGGGAGPQGVRGRADDILAGIEIIDP